MSVNELTVANCGSCCLEVAIKVSKLFRNEFPQVNFSLRKSKSYTKNYVLTFRSLAPVQTLIRIRNLHFRYNDQYLQLSINGVQHNR
jgi:hypothetical protein